jgi:hypothetical protein
MKEELFSGIIELIAPGKISKHFDAVSTEEQKDSIFIIFEEKKDLIPKELSGKQTVLDGFLNPLALQTFPLKDKQVYLVLKRRRWKELGKTTSYFNTYDLHRKGMKTTNEFGDFLKEELGLRPSEYNKLWKSITG